MRPTLLALLMICAHAAPCIAGPPERAPALPGPRMQDVESKVYPASGSIADLTKRGETCIARVVRYDGPDSGKSVIASASPESGLIVANSRIDIRHGLMQSLVQSALTFEARDGRFRLIHSDIRRAERVSGVGAPFNEFGPVAKDGSFSKLVLDAMQRQFSAISECMSKPSNW